MARRQRGLCAGHGRVWLNTGLIFGSVRAMAFDAGCGPRQRREILDVFTPSLTGPAHRSPCCSLLVRREIIRNYYRCLKPLKNQDGNPFRLLANKAYSHPSTRSELRSRRIKHTIPERLDQIERRKAKGSAGGRPPASDPAFYKERNTVERGFNRLKRWRGIATRYDKYATAFLGGVLLTATVTFHRVHN